MNNRTSRLSCSSWLFVTVALAFASVVSLASPFATRLPLFGVVFGGVSVFLLALLFFVSPRKDQTVEALPVRQWSLIYQLAFFFGGPVGLALIPFAIFEGVREGGTGDGYMFSILVANASLVWLAMANKDNVRPIQG
jgi:hypothetical protein